LDLAERQRRSAKDIILKVVQIPVKEILVDPARSKLSVDSSMWLEESISLIGLRTPISVRARADGSYDLVAGRQRLLAVMNLGKDDNIDAFVYPATTSDLDIELWEVIENLHRSDLDTLERSHLTGRYAQLEEKINALGLTMPAIIKPASQVDPTKDVLAQLEPKPNKGGRPKGGARQLARALGRDRNEIRRELKIDSLSNEAKEKAGELGLGGNQKALLDAAKHQAPEAQIIALKDAAKAVKAPRANRKEVAKVIAPAAIVVAPVSPVVAPVSSVVATADSIWDAMTEEERVDFTRDVVMPWAKTKPASLLAAR
jgi:ParB-like chromosome segregation protein Spo0J